MTDRETELREQLAALHRRYYDEAAPIVDELTKIEAMRPRVPLVYGDLLPALARKGYVPQVMQDLATMIADARSDMDQMTGVSIVRMGVDGTIERIAPEDFYAKPEGERP